MTTVYNHHCTVFTFQNNERLANVALNQIRYVFINIINNIVKYFSQHDYYFKNNNHILTI